MDPYTVGSALGVVLLACVFGASRRVQCFARGHHLWDAAYTETKRRVHRCAHCSKVEDYPNVVLKVPVVDQRQIDGSGWNYSPAKERSTNVVSIGRKKA